MKRRIVTILFTVIAIIILLLPLILDTLMEHKVLTFSPGAIDAWINFWGSYIGAIIGASVVYFVAKVQMKKQDEQQIEELELRGTYEMKREMKFFYTTLRIEKIEEFIHVTDELPETTRGIFYNMFQMANVLSEPDMDETEKKALIEELKSKGEPHIEKNRFISRQIDHLARYITELDGERVNIISLIQKLESEWESIEMNYETYVIDPSSIEEGFRIFGVPKEVDDETSRISQMLKATLRNVQESLGEIPTSQSI